MDVSEKGVRFQTEQPLPVGALIDFRVELDQPGKSINACGRVVHVTQQPDGRYQAALRVTDMESSAHSDLLQFLRASQMSDK